LTPGAVLSEDDVRSFAATHCRVDRPVRSVGVEVEWFVVDAAAPFAGVPPERTRRALAGCPLRGRLTFEPGGQLELSSPPEPLRPALAGLTADLAAATPDLRAAGLRLVGLGTDPVRPSRQWLHQPRYEAMRRYFGPGPGATMMCSTAGLQVNLDLGTGPARLARWELAHALGPVLVAAFAASPLLDGRVTGWRSTRQAVWARLDPTRTRPVQPLAADPAEAWVRLARAPAGGGCTAVTDGSTFADWLAGAGPVRRPPTMDDLAYHATTVFPPVRPRGWLELRYLDSQPGELWRVAVAVTTALLDDPVAADAAAAACQSVAGRWSAAARSGLGDRGLHRAARCCLRAAVEALPRVGADAETTTAVARFADRYVEAGRCPADDLLELARTAGPAALLRPVVEEAVV
jgi:glutamate--cysteine ligase